MIRVILETPFAGKGDTSEDRAADAQHKASYLSSCIRDCLARGESPFASHRMYTAALDDDVPGDRALGIDAGFAWREAAEKTVVYTDLGVSSGMLAGVENAKRACHVIEYRELGGSWTTKGGV